MMHKFLQKWRRMMTSKDTDIRERVFCKIASVGGVAAILAFAESLFLANNIVLNVVMSSLLLSVVLSIYFTVEHHKINLASLILTMDLALLVFPTIFFTSGGIDGGATVWFILNVVVTVLLFNGKVMHALLVLDVVSESLCYLVAYYHPEYVIKLASNQDVYLDSAFSVIAVGMAISVMMRFHSKAYAEQQKTVQWQKEELERNNESQTHFFASMSHELRTPINTIIGLNNMILRESEDEETLEYSTKIKNSSKMLLSLINDILDLSQLETRKMTLADNEYNVREFFTDIISVVGVLVSEKKLELLIDIDENLPSVLLGDRKRIQQVLINLLSNAVKYTPAGSVTLSANIEKIVEDELTVRISVQDTGIGIKKEHLKNIYDVFKRVDMGKNEKVEGSGLGLAITKQIVDLLDGEITVDSIYTKGSVFTVIFKQKIVDASPIGKILENQGKDVSGKINYQRTFEAPEAKILVVDDIPTNGMIIQKQLKDTKVSVDVATSGEECLSMTKNKFYHLILMDHMMPGMDGEETLKALRKQENGLCREVPVVALTANSVSNAEQHYQILGFDGYLEKPLEGQALERTILSMLPRDLIEYVSEENEALKNINVKEAKRLRKRRLIVTCDCVAEISSELLEKMNIDQMYLYIETPKGRFADTVEIDVDNLARYVTENGNSAVSASASVEEYEKFFAEQLTKAEEVVHISLGSECGKSYSVAVTAAESFGNVHVVDSGHIACGERMIVLYAAQMAKDGATSEEIIKQVNKISQNIVTEFLMPNAKSFYDSGYTSYFTYKFCDFFNLHPILKVKNAGLHVCGVKFGSFSKARRKFVKDVLRHPKKIANKCVFVSHVGLNSKEQKAMKADIQKWAKDDTTVYSEKASLSCACNSGYGSIGISYYRNRPGGPEDENDSDYEINTQWMYK